MKILYQFITLSTFTIILAACGTRADQVTEKYSPTEQKNTQTLEWDDIIIHAEGSASPTARKVLFTLRQMIERGEIIKGGCWDYLDAGFTRAGVPRAARKVVLKSNKHTGPYVNINDITPGDWLYYINHSYGGVEHSGVFIGWVDKANKEALILSYAGEHRQEPGRYSVYDLSHVYQITRP